MTTTVISCCLLLAIFVTATTVRSHKTTSSPAFNSKSFPSDFIFGAGSSAYQYEGAANKYGKGPSIWDTYTHEHPEKITDRSNADVTLDFYHRYKEDIKLMKFEGLNGFKFSISWSRLLPYGKLSKGVNKEGIAFYNNLINDLLANGIQPFALIFHYDLPQALEDEYQGFLNTQIVDDFLDYAELCFREFGDRVKLWCTINEPFVYAQVGYHQGIFPPAKYSNTEPFIVGHNMLLAHAKAVNLYREKYMASQKGEVGMSLLSNWCVPSSNSKEDKDAAQLLLDLTYGWFAHPVIHGDYPETLRKYLGDYLPKFNKKEAEMVKGSYDFFGLNYYLEYYASADTFNFSNGADSQLYQTIGERYGKSIGGKKINPSAGLYEMLVYTKEKYNNPIVYITENGMGDENVTTIQQGINDFERIDFLRRNLLAIKDALQDGANIKGYFAWSFLDTFEWTSGYTKRYGLNYVDYKDNLKRYPKRSALWLKKFISSTKVLKFDY